MREDYIKCIGNVFLVLGIIGGIILIFTKVEGSYRSEFSSLNISLGISAILSSTLIYSFCHWMAWMLAYSRERVGLLNEVIDELKKLNK